MRKIRKEINLSIETPEVTETKKRKSLYMVYMEYRCKFYDMGTLGASASYERLYELEKVLQGYLLKNKLEFELYSGPEIANLTVKLTQSASLDWPNRLMLVVRIDNDLREDLLKEIKNSDSSGKELCVSYLKIPSWQRAESLCNFLNLYSYIRNKKKRVSKK